MANRDRRSRLVHTSLAVGFSVFFYACGRPPAESVAAPTPNSPDKPAPATASMSSPGSADRTSPAPVAGEAQATFGGEAIPADTNASQAPVPSAAASAPALTRGPVGVPAHASGGERVITNADLARYSHLKEEFGLRDGVVMVDSTTLGGKKAGKSAGVPGDPTMSVEEIDRETRAAQLQMEALNIDIESLRKRIPSLHNPFLPRVAPGEADALAEAGMDNAERLARVNQRIAEDQQQLGALGRRLLELHAMSQASRPGAEGNPTDSDTP